MISVQHLIKCYGNFRAVDDLSFEIEDGHIYGFLGPNGAGKTTTMNIMTGCLSQTEGSVTIDGLDIFEDAKKAKKLIGYLPEIPPLYVDSTPYEYLTFVARAKGVGKKEVEAQVEKAMEATGLTEMADRLIKHLSKGYKQRVGIAQAILGEPKVIILDEPTVGLDPSQIIDIRNLIKKLGETHTVILSSHILSEVQAICEKVLIISHGKLVAFDEPENLEKLFVGKGMIKIKAQGDCEGIRVALESVENAECTEVRDLGDGTAEATVETASDNVDNLSRAVFEIFSQKGYIIYQMTPMKASLEDVFIELTKTDEKPEIMAKEEETIGINPWVYTEEAPEAECIPKEDAEEAPEAECIPQKDTEEVPEIPNPAKDEETEEVKADADNL